MIFLNIFNHKINRFLTMLVQDCTRRNVWTLPSTNKKSLPLKEQNFVQILATYMYLIFTQKKNKTCEIAGRDTVKYFIWKTNCDHFVHKRSVIVEMIQCFTYHGILMLQSVFKLFLSLLFSRWKRWLIIFWNKTRKSWLWALGPLNFLKDIDQVHKQDLVKL